MPRRKPPRRRRRPLVKTPNEASGDRTRTCIAGGGAAPPAGLIRFALSPDGVVTPDLGERLGGRGAWVSADRAALEKAVSKGLFARAFKCEAKTPAGLVETVSLGLERRALDALGLARRVGDAVLGFDQVKKALAEKKAAVLLSAADAADDGRLKLSRIGEGTYQYRGFTSATLSAAFGKEGVRHAALRRGAAATRFKREAERLANVKGEPSSVAED